MRVELHEAESAVPARDRAQLGERDGVVAAHREREDTRVDERRERFLDLCVRPLRVARRDRHVAEVDDRERLDDVHRDRGVVRAEERRRRANRLGAEPRARAEARPGVERDAERGRVDAVQIRHVRRAHERADAREPGDDLRVEWAVRRLCHSASVLCSVSRA